jgi:hypothetical protein
MSRFPPETGFSIPIAMISRQIFGMVPGAAIYIVGAVGTWVHGRINSPIQGLAFQYLHGVLLFRI